MTHRLLATIIAATFPLVGCTVNLGTDAGSDGTESGGDGDGDSGGDGDGDSTGDGDGDSTGDGDGDTQSCPDGTLDCPCYGNNTCNDGLECVAGICEPASGDGDGDGDTTGDGDGDTTGDGDGDTTGDGDGDGDVIDLMGWTKKRDIIIENQWVGPLDDYQVLMVIPYDSDMQLDFEDLRFTNEADDTLLPFWIEEFTAPVNATLFVRVPSLPVNQPVTIHMYYGNPNATSASDGVATFDFFDDFDGPNLDNAIWSMTAPVSFQQDYLQLTNGAIYTDNFVLHDKGRIEAKMRWVDYGAVLAVARQQGVQVDLGTLRMWMAGGGNASFYASAFEMGMEYFNNIIIGQADPNTWLHVGIAIINGQIVFFRNRGVASTYNVDFPGDFFVTLGHAWGADGGQMPIGNANIDFILRRGYAAVEPDYMVGVEENN